jgi:hypothetical protein
MPLAVSDGAMAPTGLSKIPENRAQEDEDWMEGDTYHPPKILRSSPKLLGNISHLSMREQSGIVK